MPSRGLAPRQRRRRLPQGVFHLGVAGAREDHRERRSVRGGDGVEDVAATRHVQDVLAGTTQDHDGQVMGVQLFPGVIERAEASHVVAHDVVRRAGDDEARATRSAHRAAWSTLFPQ